VVNPEESLVFVNAAPVRSGEPEAGEKFGTEPTLFQAPANLTSVE
jgi:hypothetical protein